MAGIKLLNHRHKQKKFSEEKGIYTLTIARQSSLLFQCYHKHLAELFQSVEPNQQFMFQNSNMFTCKRLHLLFKSE